MGRFPLLVLLALGASPREQEKEIFARFDHREHAQALDKAGLGCTACHQVGLPGDDTLLLPPDGACHWCHAPGQGDLGGQGGGPRGPGRCQTCHEVVEPPASHAPGWLDLHGADARSGTEVCENCHRRRDCVDCHERRDAASGRVHDRAWIGVHGIAARVDPASCGTCHVKAECISCHASGAGFGRRP